ncbi:MAG: glutamate-ammonia-ligase adenylyltransferase, partial [bacterium]
MMNNTDIKGIMSFPGDAGEESVKEHISMLPQRYLECYEPKEIALHVKNINDIDNKNPLCVLLDKGDKKIIGCTVLAYDYVSLFSIITGVLTSMGFNIISGDIFTYAKALHNKKRKVVDRFAGFIENRMEPESWAQEFEAALKTIVLIMEKGEIETARQRVNEMVVRKLANSNLAHESVLFPVHMEIDNNEAEYTRLKVVSEDTPAFLYSLSNALTQRGVSIERVQIKTIENRIEDEIYFTDSQGRKIQNRELLDQVKLSVLFAKQFTYFLPKAPDPYLALNRFSRLLDDILKQPSQGQWFEMLSKPRNLGDLARLLGASDFMWEDFIRVQHEMLLPILEPHVDGRRFSIAETLEARLRHELGAAKSYEEQCTILNGFKDREIFLIDLDHIMDTTSNETAVLGDNLTNLAQIIVRISTDLVFKNLVKEYGIPKTVGDMQARFAVFGLGKFGGEALGYASDIELLTVYSDAGETNGSRKIANAEFFELFVKNLCTFIRAKREGIMTIDLQLRPYGKDGPLACSLESFCRYYGPGGNAHSYERLSLVRLRTIAGNVDFGAQVERLRD